MMLPLSGLFLWLAITGGYSGWENPVILGINGALSAVLVIFVVAIQPQKKPLTPWLAAFLAVQLISAVYNRDGNIFPLWRTVVWIALYHLPLQESTIRRAALLAGLVYIPLSPWMPDGNNVAAFNIWTLYFLADYRRWWFTSITALAMILTQSAGGILALGVGVAVQYIGTQVLWLAPVGIGAMTLAKWVGVFPSVLGGNTVGVRLDMLRYAIAGLLRSPVIGNSNTFDFVSRHRGAIVYHWRFRLLDGDTVRWGAWHAHNLIADIGFQTGIIGLIVFAVLVFAIYRLPQRNTALILAFLIHSLVDSPIYYFLPAVGILVSLGASYEYRLYNSGWYHWYDIRRCRFGAGVANQTSFSVDTRPADTGSISFID